MISVFIMTNKQDFTIRKGKLKDAEVVTELWKGVNFYKRLVFETVLQVERKMI